MTADHVKNALAKAPLYKYPEVQVTSVNGNVDLTGFVALPVQRERAAQIASRVPGVAAVYNDIRVQSGALGAAKIYEPVQTGHGSSDTQNSSQTQTRPGDNQGTQSGQNPGAQPTQNPSQTIPPDQNQPGR